MDHGKLTDHNGKKVDFRNVILIMTTNAGASDMAKRRHRLRPRASARARTTGDQAPVHAGVPQPSRRHRRVQACRGDHRPGGRASSSCSWKPSWRTATSPSSFDRRGGRLAGQERLRRTVFGARPLARVIQEHIKKPLADDILFGKLAPGPLIGRHGARASRVDKTTLMLPDRSGNNRVDSLSNVVSDPRIAMLFLVPGVSETMRVNGRAKVSVDADLIQSFADLNGKLPRSVMVVSIDRCYVHCSQSLARSKLWDPAAQIDRKALPSIGQMLQACRAEFDGAAYDRRNAEEGSEPED
jgi:PPOX class probable FMN-dependent enzyme